MKTNRSRVTAHYLGSTLLVWAQVLSSPCLAQVLLVEKMQRPVELAKKMGTKGAVGSPTYKNSKEMGKKGELAHHQGQI